MKTVWFKRWGWIHLPVSVPGVIVALVALSFCLQVFLAVDRKSHSASDTLYDIFPYFTCAFLLYEWIAGRASGSKPNGGEPRCRN
jgi:hypothetical protein